MNFMKRVLEKMKVIIMWTLIGAGTFLLIVGANSFRQIYRDTDLFDLKKIIVKNEYMLTEGEIVRLSGLRRGTRIMDIDMHNVQKKIERSPFIESSKVTRIYPSTVVIDVKEKKPLAYIITGDGLKFVDPDGRIMGKVNPEGSYDLPVINAESGMLLPVEFLKVSLELSPFVYHQVSEVGNSDAGVELFLIKSSARVIIGKTEFDKRIVLLENFLKEEYDSIAFENIDYIDFRFDKQVVLKELSSAK